MRWFALGVAVCVLALLGGAVVAAGSALLTIRSNVRAMAVPTMLTAAEPGAAPPTAPAARPPSATPQLDAPPTDRPLPPPSPTPVATARASATALPAPRGTVTQPAHPAALPPGSAVTVLLLGVDRRPDESGPARSDAIAVARLDLDNRRVSLLSLPRDLQVEIPGYGPGRINAANAYGDRYPKLGGGLELARKTVSNLLGMPIDYVVRIDFEGFIGAVDAIGGITVDVEKELYDPNFPTMDYGYVKAHFLAGPQEMDGARALMYARIRHTDSDFGRMKRQQAVMLGILNRVREQNILEQLQSLAALTTALRDYIQTDLPQDRMVDLAWSFRDLQPGAVDRFTLDSTMVAMGVVPNDRYALVARDGAIDGLVRRLLGA